MTQPNFIESVKQKFEKFHWSIWFPYPSSWLRAIVLVPLVFPGARLIVIYGFGVFLLAVTGNSLPLLMFSLIAGLIIPTIVCSFLYHFLWFIWKQKSSRNLRAKWFPKSNSWREGFLATAIVGLSFTLIFIFIAFLAFLKCKLSVDGEAVSGCMGRDTGRAAAAIFGMTDNVFDLNGRGVVVKNEDEFGMRPWFVLWLVIAAYLYQTDYLARTQVLPWIKSTLENYKSRRYSSHKKSKIVSKKLLITFLTLLLLSGLYLFTQSIETKEASLSPTGVTEVSTTVQPTPFSASNPFREAVNKATIAANLAQTAKSQDEWKSVATQWQEAIALMKSVPMSDSNYTVAQSKSIEYEKNFQYAQQRVDNL